jgi:integrase
MICERVPPTRAGRRVRKWVPTLVEAAKLLEEAADQPAPAADLGPTLKDFSEDFLKRHEPARHSPRTYASNVKILLKHFGSEVRLGVITVPMVLDFRISRIEVDEVKDYSTNRQVAALSAIFEAARRWGVWKGANPCREVKPFKEADARTRVFSAAEVQCILDAAVSDPPFRAMILTALYTGLRKGELRALRLTDLHDGFIHVRKETSKGNRGRRVPIHPDLAPVMGSLEQKGPFLFHLDGEPFNDDEIRHRWSRLRRDAKIDDGWFHDLRRTAGTAAMRRGLGTGMIQRLLGHRQAATTERYLHADAEALAETTSFLGPPLPADESKKK